MMIIIVYEMKLEIYSAGNMSFEKCLSDLFNGTAAASNPSQIIQPCNEDEVSAALKLAVNKELSVSVLSGGASRFCAQNNQITLDLSSSMNKIDVEGNHVRLQGGVSMGMLLKALAPHGRMVPVGTHPRPGFGMLTMGGIGHLSRSLGLTLDALESLQGVRVNGEKFRITGKSTDQELWTLLRGGALYLAVITEAELRTFHRQPLSVRRVIKHIDRLENSILAAENLNNQASCSMILAVQPDRELPSLLVYGVAAEQDRQLLDAIAVKDVSWSQTVDGLESLPAFEMPLSDGSYLKPLSMNSDRYSRNQTWNYSISLPSGCGKQLAEILQQALQKLPNRMCRIDLQHIGGKVNEIPIDQTLYRGRHAQWSVVVSGGWHANDEVAAAAAIAWADDLFDSLVPYAIHYYLAERHPGTTRYKKELQLGYGPWLDRLRKQKAIWDENCILPGLD